MTIMLDLFDDRPRCRDCRTTAIAIVYTSPLGGVVAAFCTRCFLAARHLPVGCTCSWVRRGRRA